MHSPGDTSHRLRFAAALVALATSVLLFGGAGAAGAQPHPKAAPSAACQYDLVNDTYSTNQDTLLTVGAGAGVLVNDTLCLSGDATLSSDVSHGTLNFNTDGTFDYTPDPGFSGDDTFVYSFSEQVPDVVRPASLRPIDASATVTIHVLQTCSTLLRDDNYAAAQDTPLLIDPSGVLANDTICFENGGPIVVTPPTHGTVTHFNNQAGGFTYTPDAGFSGVDTFTYTLDVPEIDARPAILPNLLATVTITIFPPPTTTTSTTTTTTPPPPPTVFETTTTVEETTTTEVPPTTLIEETTTTEATTVTEAPTTTSTTVQGVAAITAEAPLARTGAEFGPMLFAGMAMVGLGLALALVARKRKGTAS